MTSETALSALCIVGDSDCGCVRRTLDAARSHPATEGLLRSVIVDVLGDALDGYGDPESWADVILNKYAALAASEPDA